MGFPNLLSPASIGTRVYKNRIVAAPIYCGTFATIPFLSSVLLQSVKEKAAGGCAQVTIGETPVDFEYANREPFEPIDYSVYGGPAFEFLKNAAAIIKAHGAVSMIELSHCGESKLVLPGLKNPIGPMGYTREDSVQVLAMDESMMTSVCESFVTCARFMKVAGFDGAVLHAGHGWLLHQFLSPRTNRRTDGYGGSLANRARFPLQVIRSVREAMGQDFVIEIRVSGDEKLPGGMGIGETAEFCKSVEPLADLFHVSVGVYRDPILSGEFSSLFQPHALNEEMSAVIKKAVSKPVVVVGGINSPELAEHLISKGKCDAVALARQLTADPDFANKAEADNERDIAKCIRCYKCFPGPLEDNMDDLSTLFGCTVNPRAFYFDEAVLTSHPKGARNVLVVGGGSAGMQAALTAAGRGHQVTLAEKSGRLGGLLNFADHDAYKGELGAFKDLLIRRVMESARLEVRLNTPVSPEDIRDSRADAVILALGSVPAVPPVKGIENALQALDVYDNLGRIGHKVVMIGGGLVGCEVGLHLAKNGRDVTVVEMLDRVAADAYPMYRIALLDEMDRMLTCRTGLRCREIGSDGVTALDRDGNETHLAADTVVFALGMRANKGEAERLRAAAGERPVFEIGDCVCPAKVYDAVRQGFVAGMSVL